MAAPSAKLRRFLHRALEPTMLVCAVLLFAAGVTVPFFNVTKMWIFQNSVSVLSGLLNLAEANEWFLFVIIFLFTLVFPLLKLGALANAWWNHDTRHERTVRMLRLVASLGKWSMLDVFVVAILIVAMKSASVAAIRVSLGVYLFSASVILTQFISMRLERRLRPEPEPEDSAE